MTDLMSLMKQAKEMQARMAEAQARLDAEEVTGESGAGIVRITMSAKGEPRRVQIDPSAIDPTEHEVLEDLVLAALGDVRRKAEDAQKRVMGEAMRGLPLPPGMGLPF